MNLNPFRRLDNSIDLVAAFEARRHVALRPASVAAALLFLVEVEDLSPLCSHESAAVALAHAAHIASRPVV